MLLHVWIFHFLWLSNIPLYGHTTILFPHSSLHGHLNCLHLLAVVHSAVSQEKQGRTLGV